MAKYYYNCSEERLRWLLGMRSYRECLSGSRKKKCLKFNE